MKTRIFPIFIFAVAALIFGCGNEQPNDRLKEVDVTNVAEESVNVQIDRLDIDLFEMNPDSIPALTPGLIKKYGSFYKSFVANVITPRGINDPNYAAQLKRFMTDKDMRKAYDESKKMYPSIEFLREPLQGAFKLHKAHFPDKQIPRIIGFMSGFNFAVAYSDSAIAIALEMHLDETCPFYDQMFEAIPGYRRKNMNKESMFVNVLKAWVNAEFENATMNKADLLSSMILSGKMLYLVDALAPEMNDTLKITYSQRQLDWCKQNEANSWQYLIQKKLLYSTNQAETMKFISDGPFTSAFGKQSPPRIAQYLGWQIVRKYMDANKEVTLMQLMTEPDAQKILAASKYKPS